MTARLILASASPRRARLLAEAGIAFEVRAANVDERVKLAVAPVDAAREVALRKARAIAAPGAWILAADTLIDHEGRALGKPQDVVDAHGILRMLSGATHQVVTAVVVRGPDGREHAGHRVTSVTFRELSDAEIDAYIRTGEPMDKAGAYGIQGGAAKFVARVEGPMDNVVGLPMDLVRELLADAGFPRS